MNMEEVRRELSTFEEWEFSRGVTEDAIQKASQSIGLPFPPQYTAFLRELGAGSVSSEEFIGLGGPRHLDVVWLTNELRNRKSATQFPRTMIPLRADDYGNYDCIDTGKPSMDGEFQVVGWQHDAGDQQVCKVLAESFFDWLSDMLKLIRRLDAEGE